MSCILALDQGTSSSKATQKEFQSNLLEAAYLTGFAAGFWVDDSEILSHWYKTVEITKQGEEINL